MTVLEIMMRVAELGLLRANKYELATMEDYLQQSYGSMGYLFEVNDNSIEIFEYDDDENPINVQDVTEEVLTDIYGE